MRTAARRPRRVVEYKTGADLDQMDDIMTQAQQNIASNAASDNSQDDSAIRTALSAAHTAKTDRKARTNTQAKAAPANPQRQVIPARKDLVRRNVVNLASVDLLAPTQDMMTKLYRLFGLEHVNTVGIEDGTYGTLKAQGESLKASLSDRALELHFQRIVGAYVGSAYGAATFFDSKRTVAREMAAKMNDDRDEDRDGPSGFESRVERAQAFAADMACQAHALHAAARGAVAAYAHVIGSDWKPYVPNTPETETLTRQAASARDAAFS